MGTLNKICLHWTGGANMPCEQNLDCYHFLFDKNGKEYKGKYKPEDNLNCTDEYMQNIVAVEIQVVSAFLVAECTDSIYKIKKRNILLRKNK